MTYNTKAKKTMTKLSEETFCDANIYRYNVYKHT